MLTPPVCASAAPGADDPHQLPPVAEAPFEGFEEEEDASKSLFDSQPERVVEPSSSSSSLGPAV
eukprot:1186786-Pyramimonas_sp.AAC.1